MAAKTKDIPSQQKSDIIFRIEEKQQIPSLPDIADKTKIDFRYPLIPPYAYAHIFWDPTAHELVYVVEEPPLDDVEKNILLSVEKGIEELINISFINVKRTDVIIAYLEKNIRVLLVELGVKISTKTFSKLMYYVYRNFVGLNEIQPLMKDYFIEDIECNGAKTPLYIVHRKFRNLRTNIVFKDMDKLASFVEKLAQKCGKYISYANPLLDGRLPDNSRINATFTEDISTRGPTFTIRKFTSEPFSPIKMMKLKTVSPEVLAFLWLLIEHETNFVVIGGTGSGKTSLLNSLAFFIPPQARIVSIEDTHELALRHENWLPSVARQATGVGAEGKLGEVNLFTLLKESFRQRPDYVIVGEIRGEEAFVLFQGAASGHAVSCTMHAEDVDTMVKRLETPPINLSPSLIEIIDVVCVMAQVKIKGEPERRLKSINEIVSVTEGKVKTNTPFMWDPRSDTFFFKKESVVFDKLVKNFGLSMDALQKEFANRTKLLMALYKRNIVDFRKVQEVIDMYYKTPDKVLRRFGIV
tara:strand:- start:28239 stop:29813 length:1575 start_codon:yes stop_codon:yes gene_type:complete